MGILEKKMETTGIKRIIGSRWDLLRTSHFSPSSSPSAHSAEARATFSGVPNSRLKLRAPLGRA